MDTVDVNAMLWDAVKILVTFSATLIGAWAVLIKFVYTKFGEFTTGLATTNTTLSNIDNTLTKYEKEYREQHERMEDKIDKLEDRVHKLEYKHQD